MPAAAPVREQPGGQREPGGRRRLPWAAIAAAAAVLIAAAAVAVVLLSGGKTGTDYHQRVAAQIAKVNAADDALAKELDLLAPGAGTRSALAAATSAANAVRDAQVALDVIAVPTDGQALHATTDAALASQAAYLAGVTEALRTPSEAAAAGLTSLALDARDRWSALSSSIAGAGGRISGYDKLAAWARAKVASAKPKSNAGTGTTPRGTTTTPAAPAPSAALSSYIAQVEDLLAYSRPGFDRINQVYAGMKAGTISWDDARAGLEYVLSNRQTALARANALPAPTTAAAEVKRLLADALDASLVNDRDILAAFNSYATEDVQSFYNSQVIASASSAAATNAKRSFLTAYNQLRASAGLAPTQFDNF